MAATPIESPFKLASATPSISRRSSSDSYSSVGSSFRRAWSVAQQPVAAVPGKARRMVWDTQMRLRAFWLTVFVCVLVFFWAWRFQQFNHGPKRVLFGVSLPIAKGCGNAMKIVIWPVLILPLSYVFTTPLRLTWLDRFVPFDYAIPFHMLVAAIGGVLAVVHALCHLSDYIDGARQPAHLWTAAFPGITKTPSFWTLLQQGSTYSGLSMLLVLGIMFSFAMPYPKRAAWLRNTAVGRVLNNYDWFWTTHVVGACVFYTLLVLHPLPGAVWRVENPFGLNVSRAEWGYSDTWVWVSIPILIRIIDRGVRWWRRNRRPTRILGAEFMGDGIVALRISRPKGFHFRPGMYVYLNMPSVARLQWHPISLAGSPSADSLALLVRNSGNWAMALHDMLRKQLEAVPHAGLAGPAPPDPLLRPPGPLRGQYQLYQDSMRQASQAQLLSKLELKVDGPFGAPAVAYRRFSVVLLVGAGVGVTPFLSILADAVEQHAAWAADVAADAAAAACSVEAAIAARYRVAARRPPVQRVLFHWLVREPTVPRWLRQTLQTAASADASHLLDINIHLTKALSRADSCASLSKALAKGSVASDLDSAERADSSRSSFSTESSEDRLSALSGGNAAKAWHGRRGCRPDFEAILATLEQAHPGTHVGVFYCGPPGLSETLSTLCIRRSAASKTFFHYRAERF